MNSRKSAALEGLRGVASLNVVLGHFLFSFFPYLAHNVRPYPNAAPKYAFENVLLFPPFTFLYLADAAVAIFFVLSGYVLTKRFYETGEPQVFESAAAKRYIRLVVPGLVSVMFGWVLLVTGAYGNHLAGPLGTAGWVLDLYAAPVSLSGALFRGLLGTPVFGISDLNSPLWTLQVELLGSILLFGSYALFGRRSKLLLAFWFLVFANILAGRSPATLDYVALLAGSFLHLAEARLKASPALAAGCFVIGLIGVSFTFAGVFAPLRAVHLPSFAPYGPDFNADRGLFWHTLGAVFLVAAVIGSGRIAAWLERPVPVYLGRVSFAIYLLHFPLIMSLSYRLAQAGHWVGLSYVAYVGLSLGVTLVVLFFLAELFYRYIDAPSIRLANWVSSTLGSERKPVYPAQARSTGIEHNVNVIVTKP